MSQKYVYFFNEGNGKMRELLGGKGANLAEMTLSLIHIWYQHHALLALADALEGGA